MNKILIILFVILCGLFYIGIGQEWNYYRTSRYAHYTIKIELLNNSIDTIVTRQSVNMHFEIICNSHKGEFRGCDLMAIPKRGQLILGGHWITVRDGVINYKVLKKVDEK